MYETSKFITVAENRRQGHLVLQIVFAARMPVEPRGLLCFTFTHEALKSLRAPHVGVEDFVMQRLSIAGFPVIETPDQVAVFSHYAFDPSKAGVVSKVESVLDAQIRYEWRPA